MAAMSRTLRRRRRWLGAFAAVSVVVAGLVLVGLVAVRDGRAAEAALTRARDHIQQASQAGRTGDLEGAVSQLRAGAEEAEVARDTLTRQPLSAVQAMPFVGSTARKAVAVDPTKGMA